MYRARPRGSGPPAGASQFEGAALVLAGPDGLCPALMEAARRLHGTVAGRLGLDPEPSDAADRLHRAADEADEALLRGAQVTALVVDLPKADAVSIALADMLEEVERRWSPSPDAAERPRPNWLRRLLPGLGDAGPQPE